MKINMRIPSVPVIVLSTVILSSLTACGGGGGNPVLDDHAFAVAIQSDGKIVAAGETFSSSNGWCVSLARYAGNGSLDTSFGNGGKVLTNVSGGATAVAIQNDGKIVVAGYDHIYSFVLVRFNSNGTLDTSFGNGGQVLTNLGGGASAIAIQSDGRIVAAGYSYNTYGYDFALARYYADGTLDPAFGSGLGIVITGAAAYAITGSGASSVAIQPDGKIVAAGGSYLIRYNIDGTLDSTFGLYGKVLSGSYYATTSGVGIQADGKIVAAGSLYNGSGYDFALTRYNIDGSSDLAFASSGAAITPMMSLYPLAPATVVPDPSNVKIVAAGYSQYQSVLTRNNSDGSPDTTFAGGELIMTNGSHWGSNSMVRGIAVQNDGKIVVAGSSYIDDVNGYDFALERYNINGSIDAGFGNSGLVTTGM